MNISANQRYLESADRKPFLWLGDTVWELFHRLNREEANLYLEISKDQGFTVIQAVVLAENDGLRVPNAYGQLPLIDLDPSQPNEKNFEHVDYFSQLVSQLGWFIGLFTNLG